MHDDAEAEKEYKALLKQASKIEGDSSDESDREWRSKHKVSEIEADGAVDNVIEGIEGHGRLSRREKRELKRALEDSSKI